MADSVNANRFFTLLEELAKEHETQMSRSRVEIDALQAALSKVEVAPRAEQSPIDVDALGRVKLIQPENLRNAKESGSSREPSKVSNAPAKAAENANDRGPDRDLKIVHFPSVSPGEPLISDGLRRRTSSENSDPDSGNSEYRLKGTWIKLPEASGPWNVDCFEEVDAHARDMRVAMEKAPRHTRSIAALFEHNKCGDALDSVIPVVDPTNPLRLLWDVIGMIFVIWDMITIPLFLSFEMEDSRVADAMGWVTLIFWSIDMILSLNTGFFEDGQMVMKHCRIFAKYFKGWFWIDCIVVVPDWIMKAMGSMTNIAGLGRVLRIARIMRTARTLRVLKLKSLFNLVYDWVDSEYSFIWMNLIKLLLLVIFLNHIVACFWYLIGRLCKENGAESNWLEDDGLTPVWGTSLGWRYLTSLHWSITQFTPASMDVSATNIPERLFSITILFWSLVALSSIIGSVSASMTALRNMSSDETKNLWMLRRFLNHKKTPKALAARIIEYVEYQQFRKHHYNTVEPEKVKLLGNLSEQLRSELANEIYSPILTAHHLFGYLSRHINVMMHRISRHALEENACAAEDHAFQAGDKAEFMYVVDEGSFQYRMTNGKQLESALCKKAWASEAALWTEWRHRGDLQAAEPSTVIRVAVNKFGEILRHHLRTWHLASQYGSYFLHFMNTTEQNSLTDIVVAADNWESILGECDTYSSDKHLRDLQHTPSRSTAESFDI